MIFYYSATGNSLWIAQKLAEKHGEQIVCATKALKQGHRLRYTIKANEAIGFIFPVHAWNPPDTLLHFIRNMQIEGYATQYVFSIATCGDSSGHATKVLKKALAKKGLQLNANWEIIMPNNYLPMQDVDNPYLEHEKLENASKIIERINSHISFKFTDHQMINDNFKAIKTSFIGYFFRKFGKSVKPFYVTSACTGCGLCAKICLRNTIAMKNQQPEWMGRCDQCLACINRCPMRAIQYGKRTETRGRYCHPSIKTRGGNVNERTNIV